MQRTPSFNANRTSPTVHQADRSPPPSQHALPTGAACKANRQRTAIAAATTTAPPSPHPGAMQPPMQFRLCGLRQMQRTPSFNTRQASPTVHQADRSPHQIITHYRNELRAKPTDGVQQLRRQPRRRPPHRTREPCEPWCNSGHPASDECNALRLSTPGKRRLPSTKATLLPYQVTPYYPNELRAKPTDNVQQLQRQPRRHPAHLTREPCKPWCNSGHPASDEYNALHLSTPGKRRLPSTKRTVVPHQVITHYPNVLRAKPTDSVHQWRRQPRRRPPHFTREPCKPWCNSGHPAFDGCNALSLSTLTERRLPSTKRTVAPTKSSRTTQTICAQSQPTTCSNYDGNDDGIPRTSPGSHATPDAISAIRPSTDATHAVFHR